MKGVDCDEEGAGPFMSSYLDTDATGEGRGTSGGGGGDQYRGGWRDR